MPPPPPPPPPPPLTTPNRPTWTPPQPTLPTAPPPPSPLPQPPPSNAPPPRGPSAHFYLGGGVAHKSEETSPRDQTKFVWVCQLHCGLCFFPPIFVQVCAIASFPRFSA